MAFRNGGFLTHFSASRSFLPIVSAFNSSTSSGRKGGLETEDLREFVQVFLSLCSEDGG